jgi:hypothetical protein
VTSGRRRYRTEALRTGGSARVAAVGQGCVVLVLACFLLPRGAGASASRACAPYGLVVQVPPVHPQSAAPLHVTVHPPAAQSVIVHVCAPWQVS